MEVSPEQLEKFRAIYREQFGVELDPKETLEKAIALLQVMKHVYQPMTEVDLQRVQERRGHLFT